MGRLSCILYRRPFCMFILINSSLSRFNVAGLVECHLAMGRMREAITVASNACKQLGSTPRALTVSPRFISHPLILFLCSLILSFPLLLRIEIHRSWVGMSIYVQVSDTDLSHNWMALLCTKVLLVRTQPYRRGLQATMLRSPT